MKTTGVRLLLAPGALLGAVWIGGCGSDGAVPAAEAERSQGLSGFYLDSSGEDHDDYSGLGRLADHGEELWIIERPRAEAAGGDDGIGSGSLTARLSPEDGVEVPVPLKHTAVEAHVAGFLAAVDVVQSFHNPFDGKIEAVYRFPLPQSAAVDEFLMVIGERRIRGILREREEAERLYRNARSQGYTASLLTQERPNLFTQAVANIEPGVAIDVHIRYLHTLRLEDDWFEFRFPMIVAPRYNPPYLVDGSGADGVGAVPRGAPGASGQATELEYLRPNERSGHDISLAVALETGIELREVHSPTHAVEVEQEGPDAAQVRLRSHDSIPNRDFVLRYKVGGDRARGALVTHQSGDAGTFALMLMPPEEARALPRQPLELVFVVDRSGSMSGSSLELAKRAVRRGLAGLRPDDRFQIVSFSDEARRFERRAVPATESNLKRGRRFVDQIEADGGTEMMDAVREVFDGREGGERRRCVMFLTDGLVGNESEVLREVHQRLGRSRVFCFGIGSASNSYLAERLSVLGRGAVGFIGPNDDAEAIADAFLERVGHPALSDPWIDWGGLEVWDVYPARVPDLFPGRPVLITGRFRGQGGAVRVHGELGGGERVLALDARWDASTHPGLPHLWARRKIAHLHEEALVAGAPHAGEYRDAMRAVALEHGLLSAWTAFVAVDSTRRTEGDHGTTVAVPVPVPEGIRYETTVSSDG